MNGQRERLDDAHLITAFGEAATFLAPAMLLSGQEPGEWCHANIRFADYTGLEPETTTDRSWHRFLRTDAAGRVRSLLLALPPDGNPSRELRVSVLSRSGTYRRCVLRAYRPVRCPDHWFVAITDVDRDHWRTRRVTQLRELLKQSLVERECLVKQLLEAQEDERSRIAADLHDRLGQSLTALKLALHSGQQVNGKGDSNRTMLALLEETELEIDRAMVSLRPYLLEAEGLKNGLRAFLEDWSTRNGIECEFECSADFPTGIPPHVETGMYRLVVAGLGNVARHANAQHVSVVLGRTAGLIYAIVEDNGVGFNVSTTLHTHGPRRRSGTVIMEHRARLLRGTCTWESTPGKGTAVYIRVPIDAAAHDNTLSHTPC